MRHEVWKHSFISAGLLLFHDRLHLSISKIIKNIILNNNSFQNTLNIYNPHRYSWSFLSSRQFLRHTQLERKEVFTTMIVTLTFDFCLLKTFLCFDDRLVHQWMSKKTNHSSNRETGKKRTHAWWKSPYFYINSLQDLSTVHNLGPHLQKSTKRNKFHWSFLKITFIFSIIEIYFYAFEKIYDQCLGIRIVHCSFHLQITNNIVQILKDN